MGFDDHFFEKLKDPDSKSIPPPHRGRVITSFVVGPITVVMWTAAA